MLKLGETIQRVAKNTIGYTGKLANKEWFYEAFAKLHKEKNVARERAIQTKTRAVKNAYNLAMDKRKVFVQKKGKAAQRRGFNRV
jgi:hypothetical protein